MPQCSRPRRPPRAPAAPWVSLRSRSLGARLRSHASKRLVAAPRPRPAVKRRPQSRKRKPGRGSASLAALSGTEDQSFLCGHAFEVLFALGLVPSQRRLLQVESSPSRISLNRMHVMEGECDKSSEMVAESAPDLVPSEDMKLTKEEPEISSFPEESVKSPGPKSGEVEVEPVVNGESESVETVAVTQSCADNGKEDDNRTKSVCNDKEENSTKEPVKEVKMSGGGSGGCSEEEDRNSVTSSQSRKRTAHTLGEGEGEGSSSESDAGGGKRTRLEADDGEDERERLVREYVEECTESVSDMSRAAEKLQREIGALGELLRAKELEWNSILRLRKLKEEMLERLLRQRRLTSVLADSSVGGKEDHPQPPPYNKGEKQQSGNSLSNSTVSQSHTNGGLMMVPMYGRPQPPVRGPRLQRPILPKPPVDQNSIVGEGRQGAILDVKSIIADYRSRHPEHVPRRGRRLRPPEGPSRNLLDSHPPVVSSTRISGSPALMSMANMALGSGSHVRENPSAPPFMSQDSSRPSSADSSRSGPHLELQGLSFKDALVQFAKLSQPPKPPPPPPPYPEVTLHPVSAPHSPPPPPHSSLLHGILTKPAPAAAPSHRATTFSPTLARLLTAPERTPPVPHNPPGTAPSHFRPPASRVNITEILSSSKKTRNEITITPVTGSNKTKDDVVLLGDDDEENDGDRLVIDESRDGGANSELPENVPECQGCHQRAAQFVCAGCGNQWYCSRECQVTAWEEHSELCSG